MAKFKEIQYWWKCQVNVNPMSIVVKLFAKFYKMISSKMVPKPHFEIIISKISKHWYWKSSYCDSFYQNSDITNIEPPNHIKPKSLKFHIEPALIYTHTCKFTYMNAYIVPQL